MFLPNAPNFSIVAASNEYLNMMGRTRNELIDRPITEIFPINKDGNHFEISTILKKSIRRVAKTGEPITLQRFGYQRIGQTKSSERYLEPTLYPLFDKFGTIVHILLSSRDVTDDVLFERRQEHTESILKQALSVGLIGTWTYDVPNNEVIADSNLAALFGIQQKRISTGQPIEKFIKAIHTDDRDRVVQHIAKTIQKGSKFEDEYRTMPHSGIVNWLMARGEVQRDANNEPKMFTGVVVDITKRKEAELAYREQQEQFQAMSDMLSIILFTARPDGTVNYVNKKWFDYTGLQLEDESEPKVGWLRAVHSDDIETTMKKWRTCIKTGEPYEIEQRLRNHNGTYRWHLGRANPIHDLDGNIALWFGYSMDIDDLRRASSKEARLKHITDTLRQQRKELVTLNRAKDEFISVASHQLRTPATAVKQYLGMILEGYVGNLTKEQRAAVETAYQSNERQLATVSDLLRVAQADAGKIKLDKENIYIRDLIREVMDEQSAKFLSRNQSVTFKPLKHPTLVCVDQARVRMVLENLLDNASKYTPEGKRITITCSLIGKAVSIKVKDEGVGIEPRYMKRLFQKFSRIDNPLSTQAGGTGLGLYWAKKIVELHGGTLSVRSTPGKGSTFTVTLPRN